MRLLGTVLRLCGFTVIRLLGGGFKVIRLCGFKVIRL